MLEATERGSGLELVQLKAGTIFYNNIEDELTAQEELWLDRDNEWRSLTGQGFGETRLERFSDENIHLGHRPSLILARPQKDYPNISFMAYMARPASSVIDQASNFSITLDIEIMVKGEYEVEVDRRLHRTCEAVHQVFVKNESLDGVSLGWDNDPVINLTDIFRRDEDVSHGKAWYWQAARIRYLLTRHNRLPGLL
jgi:hypothetical protein